MNITTEEMSFLWKLAQESVQKESEPPKPEIAYREPPREILERLPDSYAVLPYIQHSLRSLSEICRRSRCMSCPMYRGTSELCARNLLMQLNFKLGKEKEK